jgi:RNAse (barnase) inhibitor barstar
MPPNAEDGRPVLVVDGDAFTDFPGFVREFSKLLDNHAWNGNLDAFHDILRGGFGTPEGPWILHWINADRSRDALGREAEIDRLEALIRAAHPSNKAGIRARIERARVGAGPTLFDELVAIIREHDDITLDLD